jgi:hypothetical protein
MKNFFFFILTVIFFQSANAFEREFRVDRSSSVSNGYAIAWGIPGTKLDFEELDKMPSEDIYTFVDSHNIANYVVDLQTNKIISSLDNSQFAELNIGLTHIGNYFDIGLEKLEVENAGVNIEAMAVVYNYKWANEFKKVLLIDSNEINLTAKEVSVESLNIDLQKKIGKFIKKENVHLFNDGAVNLNEVKPFFINQDGNANKFSFDYAIPKSEEKTLRVEAVVKLKLADDKIEVSVVSVTQKQFDY